MGAGSLHNFQIPTLTSLIGQDQDQPMPGSGKTLILYVDRYQEGESWIDQLNFDKVSVTAKFPQIPVGGRPSLFKKVGADKVGPLGLGLKEKGYKLEFNQKPFSWAYKKPVFLCNNKV